MFEPIAESIGRSIGREIVDEYIESGKLEAQIDEAVRAELAKIPWFQFVKHIQAAFQKADPTFTDRDAFYRARDTCHEYLRDEKIEFGDTRYDWSIDGAREVAQSYEMDHWEVKAER